MSSPPELPALPEMKRLEISFFRGAAEAVVTGYSEDQMREYALAALAAAPSNGAAQEQNSESRKGSAEPRESVNTPVAAPPSADEVKRLADELRNIANAKRFDREYFTDDTEFADWAQSQARHALCNPGEALREGGQ